MNLLLIGMKYAGKTSVGEVLSEKLKRPFLDTDLLLETHYRRAYQKALTVQEIYQNHGSSHFRMLEKEVIQSLKPISNTIIATGGGILLDPANSLSLKKLGKLIYLETSLETLMKRLIQSSLPVFLKTVDPQAAFIHLYEKRKSLYEQAADISIQTEESTVTEIADQIILLLKEID